MKNNFKHNFDNPIKRLVHELIYDNLPKGGLLTVVGPEFKLHVKYFKKYIKSVGNAAIHIYEIATDTIIDMQAQHIELLRYHKAFRGPDELKFISNIKIHHGNVMFAPAKRSIDLDLCASFMGCKVVIDSLFKKHLSYTVKGPNPKCERAFTFTCSERSGPVTIPSYESFLKWRRSFGLADVHNFPISLGGKMDIDVAYNNQYAHLYPVRGTFDGNKYLISQEFIIRYKTDGGPMFTWFIKYRNK
jgi:hypothetical protein